MPSSDGGDDAVWVGGPGKGPGVCVGLGDEAVDGGLQVDDGAEDAALEATSAELGEEALNRFVTETNANPRPFTWTADPDRIIAAVGRGHQALDSIH